MPGSPEAGGQGRTPPQLQTFLPAPHRLLLYPQSTHALSEVEVESDSFMNAVLWLRMHLGS